MRLYLFSFLQNAQICANRRSNNFGYFIHSARKAEPMLFAIEEGKRVCPQIGPSIYCILQQLPSTPNAATLHVSQRSTPSRPCQY